jgi:hypothetical protein
MGRRENAYRLLVGKQDQGVGGRIILRWILERQDGGGMDQIDLAEDSDRWRALVNMEMNLRIP